MPHSSPWEPVKRPLSVLLVACVVFSMGLHVLAFDSPLVGLTYGLFMGIWVFAVVGLVFVGLSLSTPRQIRLLQALFAIAIVIPILAFLRDGESLLNAVGNGIIAGSLGFVSLTVVTSVVIIGFWVRRRHGPVLSKY